MLDLIDIIIIGIKISEEFQKPTFWQPSEGKNNRIFGVIFFAQLQSVAISQWSLRVFALTFVSQKQ